MNTTFILITGLTLYYLIYRFYGRYLEKTVVNKAEYETPAHRLYDNVDFIPANKYVLFGHHFASIAGAAPIVGPVIAMVWGWLPGLLWIWFGNIFIGAVHDYLSLMSSVRYDGHSVQWIAGRVIKKRTGYLFSVFVFFVLILVVAAFGSIIGRIFVKEAAVPSAYILKIVAALVLGILMYRLRINFFLATAAGIIMLAAAIVLGKAFPVHASYQTWMIVFFLYIIVAASIPVNILLQPRDYLNAWLLIAGLVIGGTAVVIAFKPMTLPAFTSFSAPAIGGIPTPFWPVIPLIIACGSLSGFHAMVASGTTSKQLSRETEGLFIGYGSMLTEGFLSTLVIVCIGAFAYDVIPPDTVDALKTSPSGFSAGYMAAINSAGGPVGIFSKSYAEAAHSVLKLPRDFMIILASMWVASFAMTTLDTTNRLARYTFVEILAPIKGRFPLVYGFLANRWTASAIPAATGIALAWTGAWTVIWPAFGGANQMLASIAMMTVAAWAIREQKVRGWNILVPALFLWLTVTLATVWFIVMVVPGFMAKSPVQAYILGSITLIMLFLNIILIYDFFRPEKV